MPKIVDKTKEFIKKHKKAIAIGSIASIAGLFTVKSVKKYNEKKAIEVDYETEYEPINDGRNCVMQFITDDEDHEVLGEVPCTETYARESIDDYNYMVEKSKESSK